MEIQEVIRRWQAGGSQRQIAEGTGLSRATVRKYLSAAKAAGVVQDGPVPDEEQLSQLAGISRAGPRLVETSVEDSLAPWADQIYQWLTGDRLTVTRIQELLAARGRTVSYTSLRRFIRKRNWGRRSVRTVRMADTAAGEVAEVTRAGGVGVRGRREPRVGDGPGCAWLRGKAVGRGEAGGLRRAAGRDGRVGLRLFGWSARKARAWRRSAIA